MLVVASPAAVRASSWSVGDVAHVEDLARAGGRTSPASRWQSRHHSIVSGEAWYDQRHLVDAAVAGRAADALGDVDAVVEVDEVGQVVDARPARAACRCGSCRARARASRRWSRSARGSSCRSASAGCRRSSRSRPRCGSSGSRCPRPADVVLMAERHGLLAHDALVGDVRRADDAADHPEDEADDEHRAEDRHARERVGAAVEDLRHRSCRSDCRKQRDAVACAERAVAPATVPRSYPKSKRAQHPCRSARARSCLAPTREMPPDDDQGHHAGAVGVERARTRSRGTITRPPAMLYENGR